MQPNTIGWCSTNFTKIGWRVIAELTKRVLEAILGFVFQRLIFLLLHGRCILKILFAISLTQEAVNSVILSLDETTPDLTYSDVRNCFPIYTLNTWKTWVHHKPPFQAPIVISGELWGLVACYPMHNQKYFTSEVARMCYTLAHSFP